MRVNIYSTLDQGYLHIAAEELYQGSVSSYNNFFTRFFSKLFGISFDIQVNGKEYRVNKRAYTQLLLSMGVMDATMKTASLHRNLNEQNLQPIQTNGFLRARLSAQKVQDLSLALFTEIKGFQDADKIQALLGQGANPDVLFTYNEFVNDFVYRWDQENKLPHQTIPSFMIQRFTPLLLAANVKNSVAVQILLRFGANQQIEGEQLLFSRTIIKSSTEFVDIPVLRRIGSHLEPRIGVGFYHSGRHKYGRRTHPTLEFHRVIDRRPGIDRQTFQNKEFRDDWFNVQKLSFNNGNVEFTLCPEAAHTKFWSERNLVHTEQIA